MKQLENIFLQFGFTDKEVTDISQCFKLKHFSRGELLLKNGDAGDYLGFIANGMFQFYYDKDAEEITTYIAFKNNFILSVQSFFAGKPSKENIKALVDSEVWITKKSDFEKLNNKLPGFKNFYIGVLEHLLVCLDESRFDYITLKPEERYMKLIKEEPELFQQVPLKYLAALIGVTPRHLSRIRNNF